MDVHPTKNVSIGIDPYPYIYIYSVCMHTYMFNVLWVQLVGKQKQPAGVEGVVQVSEVFFGNNMVQCLSLLWTCRWSNMMTPDLLPLQWSEFVWKHVSHPLLNHLPFFCINMAIYRWGANPAFAETPEKLRKDMYSLPGMVGFYLQVWCPAHRPWSKAEFCSSPPSSSFMRGGQGSGHNKHWSTLGGWVLLSGVLT